MIFGLLYLLYLTSYSAVGLLIGSFLIKYVGASELELGLMFMIQPLTIFARPFICAQADRFQSHQKLLKYCLLGTSLAYIPYILLPYLIQVPSISSSLTTPIRFAILAISHFLGSICYCGIRSLSDTLAVNYAKRIGTDFTTYRKWGSLSFGTGGYLIGLINQGWIMPDFVPGLSVYSITTFVSSALVHLWPDEFFVIIGDKPPKDLPPLPSGREVIAHMGSKLRSTILCCGSDDKLSKKSGNMVDTNESGTTQYLSNRQQLSIFWLLLKRDFRITLYLILLTFSGLTAYSPQNYVFTYMNITCNRKGTCNAAALAGLTMFIFCLSETTFYMLINAFRHRMNHIIMLQITFLSLIFHYFFYAFVLDHVSPYWFLIESLHGLEYSLALAASLDLALKFATEVEHLIPELLSTGVISEKDDQQLVRVSLIATMNGLSTLCYDGIGTFLGAGLYGFITDKYSFTGTWIVNGSLSTAVFISVIVVILVGKCFHIRPEIDKIRERAASKSS